MQSDYSDAGLMFRRGLQPVVLTGALVGALAVMGAAMANAFFLPDAASSNGGSPAYDAYAVPLKTAGISNAPIPLRIAGTANPSRQFDDVLNEALDRSAPVRPELHWKSLVIQRGQTLSRILAAQGLPSSDWATVGELGGAASALHHLRSGETLHLKIEHGHLAELNYPLDESHTLNIHRAGRGFEVATLTSAVDLRTVITHGVIESSLFLDASRANLSDRLILQFAELFNYDIDFAQDLRPGDSFAVEYSALYKNGRKLRDGDIVAAEFINQGHRYRAVRYIDKTGRVDYLTPEGLSLRKAFIRTPVDFTRISSGFSLARWHPILNRMRAHTGVDYAAPVGTPVRATGEGSIETIGVHGGYGNLIVIKHWGAYETAYGHLSRFKSGLHVGSHVQQGEVIGYVGMTGLATGPHLHYEFRVNGVHKDPMSISLPRVNMLAGAELAHFKRQSASLVARVDEALSSQYARAAP